MLPNAGEIMRISPLHFDCYDMEWYGQMSFGGSEGAPEGLAPEAEG